MDEKDTSIEKKEQGEDSGSQDGSGPSSDPLPAAKISLKERYYRHREIRQAAAKNIAQVKGSLSAYMNWPIWFGLGLLILCGTVTAIDWLAGGVASAIALVMVIFLVILTVYYYQKVSSDMVTFGAGYAQIQKQLLQDMSVPYAVTDERGALIWMNKAFAGVLGDGVRVHKNLSSVFPNVRGHFPKGEEEVVTHSSYQGKNYAVTIHGVTLLDIMSGVINADESNSTSPQMYGVYLYDETESIACREKLKNDNLVMALIYMDNYDEAIDSIEEVRKSLLVALIDRQISKYISNYQGVIRRLENDKYFAILTYEHLQEMQEDGFSLVEEVKKINIGNTTAVTVSIGLGINGGSYTKTYEYARSAIDMALGRGGDQVVLKDGENINYYGGKVQNQGKTTRVKARVKAHALRELIESADDVMIMGHHISDADCIGAAAGIYRAAAYSRKKAWIVLDTISNNIRPLLEKLESSGDYDEEFMINNDQAIAKIHSGTLLVIVDNNRPSYCECPGLFNLTRNVVVIDHHRQAKDCVENPLLSYVEPYASSASEMVAEILQYYADDLRLKPADAESLYSGIVVDTNNFMNKTGVRTFEAAAFLRRNGADVTRVRKLFRDDMEDYRAKAEIVRKVEIYQGCYAISECDASMTHSPTVIAAQAANEMLGIQNIKASFVLTDYENQIYISARSIDEINVQVIMEKLGGGGHLSIAGAQLKDVTMEEAKVLLKDTIRQITEEMPQ